MTEPLPGRRYNDKEVARIIKQASELQQSEAPGESGSGLSLAELEQIAREAGIDPAMVRRAAVDLDAQVSVDRPSRFLGAPSSLSLDRTIDGEISPDEYEMIILEIQRAHGEMGTASMLGRTLQWTSHSVGRRNANNRTVQVVVTPRHGRTTIHIEERLSPLASGIFGGLLGGVGAGMMVPVAMAAATAIGASGGALSAATGAVGAGAGFLAGAYLLARSLYGRIVSKRGVKLQALMSGLAEHVAAAGTPKG